MYATNGGLYPGITILLTCDDDEVDTSVSRQSPDIARHPKYLLDAQAGYRDMADRNTTGTRSTPAPANDGRNRRRNCRHCTPYLEGAQGRNR